MYHFHFLVSPRWARCLGGYWIHYELLFGATVACSLSTEEKHSLFRLVWCFLNLSYVWSELSWTVSRVKVRDETKLKSKNQLWEYKTIFLFYDGWVSKVPPLHISYGNNFRSNFIIITVCSSSSAEIQIKIRVFQKQSCIVIKGRATGRLNEDIRFPTLLMAAFSFMPGRLHYHKFQVCTVKFCGGEN